MKTVDQQIEALIGREGAYTNNPADGGGPTIWGVTEQVARAYGYHGDMRLMPQATAKDIYRRRYWLNPHLDQVAERYARLAEELLDTGVNMGPKRAATLLQVALNVLNRQHTDYPDIPVDGDIGPMTVHSLDGFKAKRGSPGESVLLRAVDCLQGAKYIDIALNDPSQETFVYGWLANRVGELA